MNEDERALGAPGMRRLEVLLSCIQMCVCVERFITCVQSYMKYMLTPLFGSYHRSYFSD